MRLTHAVHQQKTSSNLPSASTSGSMMLAFLALLLTSLPTPASAFQPPQIAPLVDQYAADLGSLNHHFRIPLDGQATQRRDQVLQEWKVKLDQVEFPKLDLDNKIDFLLLKNEIESQLAKLHRESKVDQSAAKLIPYGDKLVAILRRREEVEKITPSKMAEELHQLSGEVKSAVESLGSMKEQISPVDALRSSQLVEDLARSVREMDEFYCHYDPLYTWWCKEPVKDLLTQLKAHADSIRRDLVGLRDGDKDRIIGVPIGSEALAEELRFAWIAHTPEELIEIAKREFAWCDEEARKASIELGFEGDWKKALEHVKGLHVQPGEQPEIIRDLAWEAIRFLEAHDLVTVPALAKQSWRMDMMSPDRQRLNPYFLGGPTIIVSFPTEDMTHEEKLMSLRSNNIHFSRATVHHELIPGHHLQMYMMDRHHRYRQPFATPFWMEGWALYWEMLLWDLGFPKSPEDRIGMLFWRKHRCARIVFSLGYQTGKMSAEECVQYLVDNVGHEPSAAAAEVRRSVMGGYGPLYQAAYMLGGLQIRQLHKELVQTGQMTNRQFHDAILIENSIPIEILRAKLTRQKLPKDAKPQWRFGD